MSVVVFDNRELEALWGALDPKDTAVAVSLYVVGCANRAAYMTTYRESVEAPTIEAPRLVVSTPTWAQNTRAWVDSLLYNCLSNGGTDFAAGALNHVKRLCIAADIADARAIESGR